MKRTLLAFAFCLAWVPASAGTAGSFEGEVDYHVLSQGKPDQDVHYLVNGSKIRLDILSQSRLQSLLMDLTTSKMVMLMPEQKMYVDMAAPDAKNGPKAETQGKVTRTGKADEILGKKVEEWIYEGQDGKASIWAARGMGHFETAFSRNAWAAAVKSKDLFPLKVVYTDKSGKSGMTMTAVRIDEKKPEAGLFQVPADYKKMDATGMLGATQGQ